MVELQYFLMPIMNLNLFILTMIGVFAGIWVGAIPGLSVTMATALLISFTFPWQLNNALALMCGVFVGGVYGGAITAILLNIPGAPAAIAAGFDGYPLAKKGEAGKAIGLTTTLSIFAGLVGVAVLALGAPLVASISLKFAPRDIFLLACMGIILLGSIGGDPIRGIMTGAIGILISLVGMDGSTGEMRYTFSNMYLMAGISYIPAMIGLFGISESLYQLRSKIAPHGVKQKLDKIIPEKKLFFKYLPLALRSSLIGVFVGALPGTGSEIAALLAYDQARITTKNPETPFGKGAYEGLVAPETANKGSVGGVFIPMLTLGIPGDSVTALFIGALFIHGLRPGPMLMINTPHLFWMIVGLLTLANFGLLLFGLLSVKPFSKIIEIPRNITMPVIIILSIVGTYAVQNSFADIVYTLIFGIIGYILRLYDYDTGPMVLGMILGPMIDANYRRAMQVAANNIPDFLIGFVVNPISLALLLGICAMLLAQSKSFKLWLARRRS